MLGGFVKGQNTEIGLFSRRKSEKLYLVWWISEIGILADMEISYFDRIDFISSAPVRQVLNCVEMFV